ncbi:MAG: hypothetical protein L0G48_08960 [Staphylococcus equorum]|nr:hypothetical protein [Staphylococcus equorum]
MTQNTTDITISIPSGDRQIAEWLHQQIEPGTSVRAAILTFIAEKGMGDAINTLTGTAFTPDKDEVK